jgi:hypothetical protein
VYFSSLEKQTFRVDNYIKSWIDELRATFRISFLDADLSPYTVAKSKDLFRDRYYVSLSMIDDSAFAAFCFDGGPMCSLEVSNLIKSKNIKRIGIISRGDIRRAKTGQPRLYDEYNNMAQTRQPEICSRICTKLLLCVQCEGVLLCCYSLCKSNWAILLLCVGCELLFVGCWSWVVMCWLLVL